jgi:hypothetical protein
MDERRKDHLQMIQGIIVFVAIALAVILPR